MRPDAHSQLVEVEGKANKGIQARQGEYGNENQVGCVGHVWPPFGGLSVRTNWA